MFGAAAKPNSFGNLFTSGTASNTGTNTTGAATGTTGSLFGSAAAPTSTPAKPSLFGTTSTPAATNTNTNLFSTPAAKPSLFGAAAATPAAPKPSLFGAQPATATAATPTPAAPTGGLFGAAKPAATTSLFGSGTAAAPAAKPSLFGAAAPAAANSTNTFTFGSTAAPSAAAPAATGGSLFGGLGTTTAAKPTTSLFGAPAAPAAAPAATTSLFGSAAVPAAAAPPTSLGLSTLAASNPTTLKDNGDNKPAGAYFDSLLASTRKQQPPVGENAVDNLPTLQLGLDDIRQRLKKLGPAEAQTAVDGRAIYLLNASGVNPNTADRDLGALGPTTVRASAGTAGAGGVSEADVETYLANLHSKTTLGMIRDGLDRSVRAFDEFLEDNMAMEWTAQRNKIYDHFGIRLREDTTAKDSQGGRFGRSRRSNAQSAAAATSRASRSSIMGGPNLGRSVIGAPARVGSHRADFADVDRAKDDVLGGGHMGDLRQLRERQKKLAKEVTALNVFRVSQRPFPILSQFAALQAKSLDPHALHVAEAYQAMVAVVDEDPEAETALNGATASARQFARMYMDENPTSADSIAMRKRILSGANRFLERQFLREAEALIAKHPHEANLGGRPDVVSKIRAYIRLRSSRKDLVPDNTELQQVQGEYVWAIVFYLLRAGHVMEAAKYVNDNVSHFRGIDRMFSTYLNGYAASEDGRLKRQLQERCVSEYTQRARNAPEKSIDPFRMACYKIIGRCELGNRSLDGLNTDVHDWVWLQFNLARESERSTELASETFGLADVQASIRDIGAKHFPKSPADDAAAAAAASANGSFGMYFYLLVLAGLYEDAIAYLYPFNYVDAVHFAIALSYYGVLRPSDPLTTDADLRTTTTRGQPLINFGRMVGHYTRDFRAADVEAAVDYLALLALNADLPGEAGRRHATMCHEALRELVLETREFSSLIGDIHPDGRRLYGLIEQRASILGLTADDDFITAVTLQAAAFAEEAGRITDAVLLYHLAGEYDTVVAIVARALSEAVALDIGETTEALAPVKKRQAEAAASADEAALAGTLSLAAIDDPVELARAMMGIYERDAMFHRHIQETNLSACQLLLEMSEIRGMVERDEWAASLDRIRALDLLPLDARGDPSKIRHYSSKFTALHTAVATNIPALLTWAVVCCTRQREMLLHGEFSGNEGTRHMVVEQLRSMTLDLTAYTSQLKYRFPPHLHEALARAAAE
ncbi:hypothetical protein TD95_002290 [Thielaviopsis punctulata]|uniref:Nuclear pore protein n=1 Tax=Thielaviopsis punctulata TaxID=72032 RepID=A0A0F4ZKP7_9PEZI|nr:hypothetical protein TD95_002290 [Thielaviopsis punctulata]